MGALDEETGEIVVPPTKTGGLCWRCTKNKSRVPGEDFTCEPCYAYLMERTDEDPREIKTKIIRNGGAPLPGWFPRGGSNDIRT